MGTERERIGEGRRKKEQGREKEMKKGKGGKTGGGKNETDEGGGRKQKASPSQQGETKLSKPQRKSCRTVTGVVRGKARLPHNVTGHFSGGCGRFWGRGGHFEKSGRGGPKPARQGVGCRTSNSTVEPDGGKFG